MNSLDAIEQVLREAGSPLQASEITKRILQQGLWSPSGATPERTVDARIAVDIKKHGSRSRFQRTGRGLFALRAWGMTEYAVERRSVEEGKVAPPVILQSSQSNQSNASTQPLSFTDAAEQVLKKSATKQPMHYKEITKQALDLGLIITRGQTPDQTMYAQILTEVERHARRGEAGRFTKLGKGMVGLTGWVDQSLANQWC
jgi:restriction system protein